MGRQIPASAANNTDRNSKRSPSSVTPDFQSHHPCWRFGNFDIDSKWGLKSLLGRFKFEYSHTILEIVVRLNLEELNSCLEELDGKEFDNVEDFWEAINVKISSVPVEAIKEISNFLFRNNFFEKIYPKLKIYENNTWEEIRQYSHGNGKSNNHNVSIMNLCKEARDRLDKMGYSDRSEIYSLRLEGKIRIYGFKEMNYLDIIWVDLNHEIYPTCR